MLHFSIHFFRPISFLRTGAGNVCQQRDGGAADSGRKSSGRRRRSRRKKECWDEGKAEDEHVGMRFD